MPAPKPIVHLACGKPVTLKEIAGAQELWCAHCTKVVSARETSSPGPYCVYG